MIRFGAWILKTGQRWAADRCPNHPKKTASCRWNCVWQCIVLPI